MADNPFPQVFGLLILVRNTIPIMHRASVDGSGAFEMLICVITGVWIFNGAPPPLGEVNGSLPNVFMMGELPVRSI